MANPDVVAILRTVFEAGYDSGYWSGQRRLSGVDKEQVIRTAAELLEKRGRSDREWSSWIDHEKHG